MLKKYLTKFTVDILPSVAATVIGAYIVNHYIVAKPAPDAPVAAAISTAEPKATAETKADARNTPEAAKTDTKTDTKADSVASIPEAGVKAKGISEKAILEKTAAEKPAVAEKSQEKSAEKTVDKPADTASVPAEPRRHQPTPREKTAARTAPAPVQPAAPAVVPVVAAPNPAPPVEASSAAAPSSPEERRDANDLARAAIERLRGSNDGASRPQETARIPEAPRAPEAARSPDAPRVQDAARIPDAARVQETPRVVLAPAVRPLPPPIMVSTPSRETFDSTGSSEAKPPYAATARTDDPRRPTPPAEIPSKPLDLRAEAAGPSPRDHTTIAEDMLSTAKSMFHAVLPK